MFYVYGHTIENLDRNILNKSLVIMIGDGSLKGFILQFFSLIRRQRYTSLNINEKLRLYFKMYN